jgi:hypothetical protein
MKKIFRQSLYALTACTALCVAFTSCSSEEAPAATDGNDAEQSYGSGYIKLNLSVNDNSSATRTENESESSEDYSDYEDETADAIEYTVHTAYLYFFDGNKPVTMSNGKQYMKCPITSGPTTGQENPENPNGTDTELGIGYYTGKYRVDNRLEMEHDYEVFVLCNDPLLDEDGNEVEISSRSEFLNSTQSYGGLYEKLLVNGFPMASRAYDGTISESFYYNSDNDVSNPVSLYFQVERSFARVRYMANTNKFNLYVNNSSYSTSNIIGTVEIVGRELINNCPTFYTFRHVGNIDGSSFEATPASRDMCYGPLSTVYPYVITPYSSTQNKTAYSFPDNDSPLVPNTRHPDVYLNDWVDWDNNAGMTSSDCPGTIGYIPDNSMHASAQKKGNSPAIVFKVQLSPTRIYYLYTGTYSSYVTSTTSTSYYSNVYYVNGRFYASLAAIAADTSYLGSAFAAVTSSNYKEFGIKYYDNERTGYYIYYLRHNDNMNQNVMGPMEFVSVRNNSYDVTIEHVAMAPYTTDEIKEIDTKEDVENVPVYLDADIVVRPWILRSQTTNLGK